MKKKWYEMFIELHTFICYFNFLFNFKVFYEPRLSSECDRVFSDYTKFIKVIFILSREIFQSHVEILFISETQK